MRLNIDVSDAKNPGEYQSLLGKKVGKLFFAKNQNSGVPSGNKIIKIIKFENKL